MVNQYRPMNNGPVPTIKWLLFAILHIPLALLMSQYTLLSTVHAVAIAVIGLFYVFRNEGAVKTPVIAAYIVGAEVLWRMTGANVFWEYGKYAIVALAGLSLLSMRKRQGVGLPIFYFVLLLMSVPLTLFGLDLAEARDEISFNLSGPLCLAVSVMFFSQVELDEEKRRSMVWMMVAPVIGIAAISAYQIFLAQQIFFSNNSNFETSGGFGPNQVSAVLGLGTVFLLLLAIQGRKLSDRLVAGGLGLGLAVFTMITFSRGGFYNIVAALLAAGLISLKNPRLRSTFFTVFFLAALVGGFWIFPRLNDYTSGWLQTRFSNFDLTHRYDIMTAEMDAWSESPILGTGPGMGMYRAYEALGMMVAAHTEYTRMIAEHGIPGIISILLLGLMTIRSLKEAPEGMTRAWTAALLVWSLVEMSHAAMRIAAIGFTFGMAAAWSPLKDVIQASSQRAFEWSKPKRRFRPAGNNPYPVERKP